MEDIVTKCKQRAVRGMERVLKTFSFVPDDKLTWTPAPAARSALQILAHCACMNDNFAQLMRNGRFPPMELPELFAALIARERTITTREEAIRLLRQYTDEVLTTLDAMTPEQIALTVETPFGFSAPMAMFMAAPGRHCDNHAAQIDYLQTCWGDLDPHL